MEKRVLLDTHTLLWTLARDARLSNEALKSLHSTETQKLVSLASLWEVSIKINLGKLNIKGSYEDLYHEIIASGFTLLDIAFEHTVINNQ